MVNALYSQWRKSSNCAKVRTLKIIVDFCTLHTDINRSKSQHMKPVRNRKPIKISLGWGVILNRILLLTIGTFLGAVSVIVFFTPAEIAPTGVTGIAVILNVWIDSPTGAGGVIAQRTHPVFCLSHPGRIASSYLDGVCGRYLFVFNRHPHTVFPT